MGTSNVYQSIYDGPAIDAAIARASEGGYIDSAIQAKPNTNLLDNWYFGNPVNQRGQTSYSANGYTIDRWRADHNTSYGTLTVDKTAGCVTLSHADDGGFVDFVQYLENPPTEIVTLSVLMLSGNLYSATGTLGNISLNADEMHILSTSPSNVALRCNPGKTISMKAAKLELGSQQTLAHQDADGNWVLNEIPDYGEQLARCQRYYQVFDYTNAYTVIAFGQAAETTVFRGLIPTSVAMRTKPTIVVTGESKSLVLIGNSSTAGVSSVTPYVINANINGIGINMSGVSITKNETYVLQAYGCKLELSADL